MYSFLIIVPDGGMLFEATGIADILQHANFLSPASTPLYQVTIATSQPYHVVHGQSGLNLLADASLNELDPGQPYDTVIITGKGHQDAERAEIADWLRLAAPHVRRVASVCGGALILAQAGLLNHRRATTHWRLLDRMEKEYPDIQVLRGPVYVQDGPVWTSAGVSSGFDLTLAMVEADYGFTLARDVAKELVMYLRRPGGQAQFSHYLPEQAKTPGPIRDLQQWVMENPRQDLSVESLAGKVAMSPRNFTRVFTRETGTTPAKYVEMVRLNAARERLEQTRTSIEQIAAETGLGSSINLRRVFERHLQVTPTEYRERFHSLNPAP
ncbi:HTH-type transcriptional regulator CdhR [Vibrio aerogenes CECT 7868]|uniref:HTH-type transcriptional regulator CdhR n=1 Tax=Vibrio aerogenes CECT 7868 TaxID=1216006 RepID=A0A1M5VDG5_9VIBR|nr:GlxA family transcriptional regulator [Vibrio aerogenes]SHH72963.1 HTH-type transcriptional regulator CdhR [Vibrio aerogenes CECT 7868]